MRRAALALVFVLGVAGDARAEDVAAPAEEHAAESGRLEAIREDLVQARFEKALDAIEILLGEPGLPAVERADALVLRAQAHVALGDLEAASRDFREILHLRPAYVPEESVTPKKALERFQKIRAELIGTLRVVIEPSDAILSVDGETTTLDATGLACVLAGTHQLRAERGGHDAQERTVEVGAGREVEVRFDLLPNARTVVLRTDIDDVEVLLDGEVVGRTRRPEDAAGSPAELVLENLPLGEHVFELRKECFRSETLKDTLAADLLDRSPKRYQAVRLAPARGRIVPRQGPSGAELRIDGQFGARLPAETLEACPGTRRLELRAEGRVVWSETVRLGEGEEAVVDLTPRPNLALVGVEAVPEAARPFVASFSTIAVRPRPERMDLTDRAAWAGLDLPPDTDLALGWTRGSRSGESDRWVLFSPVLRQAVTLDGPPAVPRRPSWSAVTWGFQTADRPGGRPFVVSVAPDVESAGLRVGDRILAVGGREIRTTKELRTILRAASSQQPMALSVEGQGAARQVAVRGRSGPRLLSERPPMPEAVVLAAWALVDAIPQSPEADSAQANLGLLLLQHGLPELAEQTWRRVSWGDRAGVGEGTKLYYLACALQGRGDEASAAQLLRRAASTAARTFDDEGPEIAPAARDRLADLGVAAPSAR